MRHLCLMNAIRPDTNQAIIESAFAVLTRDPTASLGDIAKHAGVGRATLHRHYAGRAVLLEALRGIAHEELEIAVATATQDAQSHFEGLEAAFKAIVPLANRQWFLAMDNPTTNQTDTDLERAIDAAKAEDHIPANIPTKWIATAFDNLLYAAWALVRDEEATPKQAANFGWRTFTAGITGAKNDTSIY